MRPRASSSTCSTSSTRSGWTALPRTDTTIDATEQRRIEYLKLQKQVRAITELVWIGADGRERLKRIAPGDGRGWRRHRSVAASPRSWR